MIPAATVPNPVTAPPPVQPQIFTQVSNDAVLGRLPAVAVGAGVGLSETFNRTKKPAPEIDGFKPQLTQEQLAQYSEIKYKPSEASRPPDPGPGFHFVPPPLPSNPITAYVNISLRAPGETPPPVQTTTDAPPPPAAVMAAPAEPVPAAPKPLPKSLLIFPKPSEAAYRSASIRNDLNLAPPADTKVDVIL